MVRIRIGGAWKADPEARGALRRAAHRRDRAGAAHAVVDVVALEVDGVDIAAGRTEGPLLATTEELARAVARLVGGGHQAAVPFPDGDVELLLRRRGSSALLSVVALGTPSRLLARDVEVDLGALARAARDAASALLEDLEALEPGWARHPAARGLRRAATRLAARTAPAAERPSLPPPGRPPRPRQRPGAPACGFELTDEEGLIPSYRGPGADLGSLLAPGRVTLRAPSGAELASIHGAPFLLLRDLAEAAARVASAVRRGDRRMEISLAPPGRRESVVLCLDVARGSIAAGRRRPVDCPPLELSRALLEAALDLCGAVLARNPRQAANPYLAELHAAASERLALIHELMAGDLTAGPGRRVRARRPPRAPSAPLGPGRVRRVVFRPALELAVGAPAGEGLWQTGDAALACGAEASAGIDVAAGRTLWRGPGACWAALAGDVLLVDDGRRLAALDARSGRARWSRAAAPLGEGPARTVVPLEAGRAALAVSGSVLALDLANGRVAWRLDAPGATRLSVAGLTGLLVAAADTGLVYGIDGDGRVVWRRRAGVPLARPVPWGGACLLLGEGPGGAHLVALDAASGCRLWDALVDLAPAGPPVAFAGLFAVSGTVGGDAVVAAFEPGGAPAWASAPSLGEGPLSVGPMPAGLAAKTAAGSCAALGRSGSPAWSFPRRTSHAPPGNLAPVACRGLLVVPSDEILVLDAASGALLGSAPAAPIRLQVGAELSLVAVDSDGLLSAFRLGTHLSLL